jgi:hypothetical protein
MPVILATWGAEMERIMFKVNQANRAQDPISKVTREKWTGSMTQAVEGLLYRQETLSSNPSLNNNKEVLKEALNR